MKEEISPLVSVMVCFLNEEKFIEEAIESILLQSYTNWEAILVDDGSTDRSSAIAKKYAGRYPGKIIYIDHDGHTNRGLSFSRNCAIATSRGEFITMLDADDIWLKDYLKLQIKLILQNPKAAMVCEATEYWFYESDNRTNLYEIIQVGSKEVNRLYEPLELLEQLYPLSAGASPCVCGIIVRKDIVERHGGFEVQFTGMYEDVVFLVKFMLTEYIYISSLSNNRYRQREGSLCWTNKNEGKYLDVRKEFLEWMEKYVDKNNFRQKNIKRLLKRAFEPYRQPWKYSFRIFQRRIYNGVKRRLNKQ